MGLFKNLYFDFSAITGLFSKLNPFPKRKKEPEEKFDKELPKLAPGLRKESAAEQTPQIPKELPKVVEGYEKKLPEIKSPSSPPILSRKSTTVIPNSAATNSFFNSLLAHVDKEEALLHQDVSQELIFKNLFSEMKTFWEDKKQVFDKDVMQQQIKEEFTSKIADLKSMETEWQRLELKHEQSENELKEKEHAIEARILELKKSMIRLHYQYEVEPGKRFILLGGQVISSMESLISALRVMDGQTFGFHVNEAKNDFANWIKDVLFLEPLANQLYLVKTREETISILESFFG